MVKIDIMNAKRMAEMALKRLEINSDYYRIIGEATKSSGSSFDKLNIKIVQSAWDGSRETTIPNYFFGEEDEEKLIELGFKITNEFGINLRTIRW